MNAEEIKKLQDIFFKKAGPNLDVFRSVIDTFRDTGFYITDDQDRIMAFTLHNCEECNVRDESEVIGKTCRELFSPVLADVYMKRDQQVRQTGRPIVNQVYTHAVNRSTEMRLVSVFPLRDVHGRIVGTVCTYRSIAGGDSIPDWYGRVKSVIAYIDAHYAERITLAVLARVAGMSTTTFRRVFAEVMQTTPNKYLTTIRLNAARKLLTETDKLISDIATETGFWDQSHFVKAFRAERGQTPSQYRRRHWSGGKTTPESTEAFSRPSPTHPPKP